MWAQYLIKLPAWDLLVKQWSVGHSKELQQSVSEQQVQASGSRHAAHTAPTGGR